MRCLFLFRSQTLKNPQKFVFSLAFLLATAKISKRHHFLCVPGMYSIILRQQQQDMNIHGCCSCMLLDSGTTGCWLLLAATLS
jgi:TRAP-type mannitol/chloroaromatic compound transport system permease small subunit